MHISSQRACLKTLPRRSFLKTAVRASIGQMSSVARYHLQQGAQLVIQEGDITEWQGDAVVNAANSRMLGGGGVDGAIHTAAGPELLQACKRYPTIVSDRCPTGDARVTLAYEMPCKWIIHTVGPIFNMKKASECRDDLRSAYMASLALANGIGASTIAFPAISCGIYGYPLQQACMEAIKACWFHSGDLEEVHFVLFGSDTLNVWLAGADKHLTPVSSSASTATSNAASPPRDEALPMDDSQGAAAAKDDSTPMEATQDDSGSAPATATQAKDVPTALQGTDAPDSSSGGAGADGSAAASGNSADQPGNSVHALKEVGASQAPAEALAAPEILEAAPPANNPAFSGHSTSQDETSITEHNAQAHVRKAEGASAQITPA